MTRRTGARSLLSACGALLLAGLLAACGQAGVAVDQGATARQVPKATELSSPRQARPTTTTAAASHQAVPSPRTTATTSGGAPAGQGGMVTKPTAPLPDGERIGRWVPVTVHFVRRSGGRLYLVPERRLAGTRRALVDAAAGLAVRSRPIWEGTTRFDRPKSPVPAGTRLLGATLRGGTATIDLSREVLAWEGTAEEATYAAGAVTATIASAVPIDELRVLVEGRSAGLVGGRPVAGLWDGLGVSRPVRPEPGLRRAPVTLTHPRPHAAVEDGSVWVQGEASTGQGVVSLRLRNGLGEVVAQTFTTAERRAPKRGAFSTSLGFTPPATAATWTLEVFESDPDDGRPTYQVAVPLRVGA